MFYKDGGQIISGSADYNDFLALRINLTRENTNDNHKPDVLGRSKVIVAVTKKEKRKCKDERRDKIHAREEEGAFATIRFIRGGEVLTHTHTIIDIKGWIGKKWKRWVDASSR